MRGYRRAQPRPRPACRVGAPVWPAAGADGAEGDAPAR